MIVVIILEILIIISLKNLLKQKKRYNKLIRTRSFALPLSLLLAYIPIRAIEIIIVLGIIIIVLFAYIIYLRIDSCVENKVEVLRLKKILAEREKEEQSSDDEKSDENESNNDNIEN